MLDTVAGDPASSDLSALTHELAQNIDIFVINPDDSVSAKAADPLALELAAGLFGRPPAWRPVPSIVIP
jgi:hypothetical protein